MVKQQAVVKGERRTEQPERPLRQLNVFGELTQ